MSKFQRTFTMKVEGRSGTIHTFKTPLTVIFDMTSRPSGGGINSAHFMIYNIAYDKRVDIQYDSAIDIKDNVVIRRVFRFDAGYSTTEGYEPTIFKGNIKTAFSYRDGPDVITDITVMDGLDAVQNAQIQSSRVIPWKPEVEAAAIANTMGKYGVKLGAIGHLFDRFTSTRGVMWLGSSWDVLRNLAASHGGFAAINKEKVYLMAQDDVLDLPGMLPRLDSSSGLIGTPRRSGWRIDARMLFEPRLELMQGIQVISEVARDINGVFRIASISHEGTISGAKDGGVITSVALDGNANGFNKVNAQ